MTKGISRMVLWTKPLPASTPMCAFMPKCSERVYLVGFKVRFSHERAQSLPE